MQSMVEGAVQAERWHERRLTNRRVRTAPSTSLRLVPLPRFAVEDPSVTANYPPPRKE